MSVTLSLCLLFIQDSKRQLGLLSRVTQYRILKSPLSAAPLATYVGNCYLGIRKLLGYINMAAHTDVVDTDS